MLSNQQIAEFQQTVWRFYKHRARAAMPWRSQPSPYYVLVSEIMLQQTQVPRVLPRFAIFVARFPGFPALAAAPLGDVLACWNGLGYNRRAKYLHETAKAVMAKHGGKLPNTKEELVELPGIGPNTAGAVLAYAYQQPVVFVETNIRTVILHHFFGHTKELVTEAQIRDLAEQVVPPDDPRQWYWALMDYGTHLKAVAGSQLQRLHGYRKQSAFQGSRRQVRGQVVRALAGGTHTFAQLQASIPDHRLADVLAALQHEGLVAQNKSRWYLTGHEGYPSL